MVRQLLAYLPRYLSELGSVLIGPKRFIAQRNANAEEAFEDSVLFLICSSVVVFLLTARLLPAGTEIVLHLAGHAVTVVLGVSLFAVALRIAWAAVGGKSSVRSFFVTYGYFNGAISVVLFLFLLVANGVVRVFEPELYAAAREMADLGFLEQVDELNKLGYGDSPATVAALAIQVAGAIVTATWGFACWGAYRQLNGLGRWRSLGAFVLFGLLSWVVLAVLYFIVEVVRPA